jgi:hypothetical protein
MQKLMRRVLGCATLAGLLMPLSGVVVARAEAADAFLCRASLARTGIAGIVAEPRVANSVSDPCVAQESSIVPATMVGPVGVLVGETTTYSGRRSGAAFASIAQIPVFLPSTPVFVGPGTTSAIVSCSGTTPHVEGFSDVSFIGAGPALLSVTRGQPVDRAMPGIGVLHLNYVHTNTDTDGATVIVRALWLETSGTLHSTLGDVVVAESVAGYRGNPCRTHTAP